MLGPSARVESVLAQEARKNHDTFLRTCSASRLRTPCARTFTVYASRLPPMADGCCSLVSLRTRVLVELSKSGGARYRVGVIIFD
jgi:hypothetical protein